MDEETPGVNDADKDDEIPGVDWEIPEVDKTEAHEAKGDKDDGNEQNDDNKEAVTRASGSMSTQKQSQKQYNNRSLQKQSHT